MPESTAEDLQHAIDWYRSVVPPPDVVGRAPKPPSRRAIDRMVDDIRTALHPLTISEDVEWFWRNFGQQLWTFDLPYPQLESSLSLALETWQVLVEEFLPRCLFPIGYTSHSFLFAELRPGVHQTAPLWGYAYGDEFFELEHASLASLFRTTAETLEVMGVQVPTSQERHAAVRTALTSDLYRTIRERHLSAAVAASRLADGPRRVPVEDQRQWPEAWRQANGITAADLEPAGATHTVAELIEAAARAPLVARLHGDCRTIVGTVLDGEAISLHQLSDDTGRIGLLVPAEVPWLGGGSGRVEVEVHCNGPVPLLPTDVNQLLAPGRFAHRLPRVSRIVALG